MRRGGGLKEKYPRIAQPGLFVMTIYLRLQGNIAEGVPKACYQSSRRSPLSEILRARGRDGQQDEGSGKMQLHSFFSPSPSLPFSRPFARSLARMLSRRKTRNTKQNRMLLGFCRAPLKPPCAVPCSDDPSGYQRIARLLLTPRGFGGTLSIEPREPRRKIHLA